MDAAPSIYQLGQDTLRDRGSWPFTKSMLIGRLPKLQLPPNEEWKSEAMSMFARNVGGIRTLVHKFFASTSIKSSTPANVASPTFSLIDQSADITELGTVNFNPQSEPKNQMIEAFISWYSMACVARLTPTTDKHYTTEGEREAGFHYFYLLLSDCKQVCRLIIQPKTEDYAITLEQLSQKTAMELDWKRLFLFVTTTIQLPNLTGVWRKCLTAANIADMSTPPFLYKPNFKVIVHYSVDGPSYDISLEQYDEILSDLPLKSCRKKPSLSKTDSRRVCFGQTKQVVQFSEDDEPMVIRSSPTQFDTLTLDDDYQIPDDGRHLAYDPHPTPILSAYNLKGSLLNSDELKKVIHWGEPNVMTTVDPRSGNLTREWTLQLLSNRLKHLQTFTIPTIMATPNQLELGRQKHLRTFRVPTGVTKSTPNPKPIKEEPMCMLYYAIKWSNLEYAMFQRVMIVMQWQVAK